MRILYIFPHPDDESFGPAPAISAQLRTGHEVFLLTLTKGGATRARHEHGYSIEQMGEIRHAEMRRVEKVLGLTGMTVLDLPDSGLKDMDPREIERVVEDHIAKVRPQIVITYAVHGISGFPDHLIGHGVIKRAYLAMKDSGADYLKRLAFYTIEKATAEKAGELSGYHNLSFSKEEDIDCYVAVDEADVEKFQRALDCYETFRAVIEKTKIRELVRDRVPFEIFGERHDPPLRGLHEKLDP